MNAKLMALVAAGGLAIGASMASAAQLVRYSFEGGNASGGATPGVADTGSVSNGTAGTFGVGSGLNSQAGGGTRFQTDGYEVGDTFGANEYMSFTFQPNVNMDFTSLTFSSQRVVVASSPKDIAVRSSLTGATNLYTRLDEGTASSLPNTVTISDAALQNVAANTTVTFYIFGTDATSTGSDLRIDDVILNGTPSAVPEPAALGLLGLGVTALLRRRA